MHVTQVKPKWFLILRLRLVCKAQKNIYEQNKASQLAKFKDRLESDKFLIGL